MLNGLELQTGVRYQSGMTENNHLVNALIKEPAQVGKLITYLMGAEKYPMTYLQHVVGRTRLVGSERYEWDVMGKLDRSIKLVDVPTGNYPALVTDTNGLNRTTFKLKFAERWFGRGDVLFGNSRTEPIRVQEDPVQDGDGWIYTMQLVRPDSGRFFPVEDLQFDSEFHKEYSAFGEYSIGGHATVAFPFKMRNQLNIMRKAQTVTGSARTGVTTITFRGKQLWINEMEWQFLRQWYEELERLMWYGVYNADANGEVHLKDDTGYPIYQGAGILQQIAASNTQTYSTLTENIIRDFLSDLHINARNADRKHFVAFTGYWGMDAFHRAMEESAKGWTLVDTHFVTGAGKNMKMGGKQLGYGSQFVTYQGLNGTTLTLKHLPLFDDEVKNRALHPVTNRPLESYRFVILDMSSYGNEPNIVRVAKGADGIDRSLMSWYTAGSTTPNSGAPKQGYKNTLRSDGRDGYTMWWLSEVGCYIRNPISCGQLICKVQ